MEVICLLLAMLNMFVFSKLFYDYQQYKNTGKLPGIIYWIPFLWLRALVTIRLMQFNLWTDCFGSFVFSINRNTVQILIVTKGFFKSKLYKKLDMASAGEHPPVLWALMQKGLLVFCKTVLNFIGFMESWMHNHLIFYWTAERQYAV